MKISAKCDYAMRALLELALRYPREVPVQIQEIAARQAIPIKYLVQILIQLKRADLVTSRRGKAGGYFLSRPPSRITLGEVIRKMEGPLVSISCIDESSPEKCSQEASCGFTPVWRDVEKSIAEVVDHITLEKIANRVRALKKSLMYYI